MAAAKGFYRLLYIVVCRVAPTNIEGVTRCAKHLSSWRCGYVSLRQPASGLANHYCRKAFVTREEGESGKEGETEGEGEIEGEGE